MIKYTLHMIPLKIKWAFQRMKRGYSDADVYAIDDWFCRVVPPMLEQLGREAHGYPQRVWEETGVDEATGLISPKERDVVASKRWENELRYMASLIREGSEATRTAVNKYDKEIEKQTYHQGDKILNLWIEEEKKIWKDCERKLREGLKMFADMFYELGD